MSSGSTGTRKDGNGFREIYNIAKAATGGEAQPQKGWPAFKSGKLYLNRDNRNDAHPRGVIFMFNPPQFGVGGDVELGSKETLKVLQEICGSAFPHANEDGYLRIYNVCALASEVRGQLWTQLREEFVANNPNDNGREAFLAFLLRNADTELTTEERNQRKWIAWNRATAPARYSWDEKEQKQFQDRIDLATSPTKERIRRRFTGKSIPDDMKEERLLIERRLTELGEILGPICTVNKTSGFVEIDGQTMKLESCNVAPLGSAVHPLSMPGRQRRDADPSRPQLVQAITNFLRDG